MIEKSQFQVIEGAAEVAKNLEQFSPENPALVATAVGIGIILGGGSIWRIVRARRRQSAYIQSMRDRHSVHGVAFTEEDIERAIEGLGDISNYKGETRHLVHETIERAIRDRDDAKKPKIYGDGGTRP